MPITSRQNPFIKRVASLKQKKYRDEFGEYIVEGEKLVREAFATGQSVSAVIIREGLAFEGIPSDLITEVSESVFKSISDEMTPQGVLAVVKIPESEAIGSLSRCLVLDGLQDPGNVGAILMIAAACDVDHVFAVSCADPYSPKAVRSSMSGLFRTKVVKSDSQTVLNTLRKQNIPIVVADMGGENVFDCKIGSSYCLILGNEGNGISEFFRKNSDKTIAIPMQNGIESLNVAVAAGIALYAMAQNQG